MEWLAGFELTAFSTWVREEWWVFPGILVVHSLGMGFLAGLGLLAALRGIGFFRPDNPAALQSYIPLLWLAFAASLLSGLMLLAGYPAKGLTNPLFYLKMILLMLAMGVTLYVLRSGRIASSRAWLLLLIWAGVIISGRFLAYTHNVLLASWIT